MSGNKVFIDTNICIYLLSGNQIIADLLDDCVVYVPFITEIELYAYHSTNTSAKLILDDFISAINVVEMTNTIKRNTIDLRKNYKLKLPDSIIAASALSLGIDFITADKGFKKVSELNYVLYEPDTE